MFFGGFVQEDDFGRLGRLNLLGSVRYRLGEGFAVTLRLTYRRVGGVY